MRRPAAAVLAAALLAAAPAAAVEVRQVTSPGGVAAWFVADRSVPLVSLSFAFRGAGAAADPAGRAGLAGMTAALLDEGAGDLDSQAFRRALDEIAASLSFGAGRDHFTGALRTLASERGRAFALLGLALARPRFDPEPLERIRNLRLLSLRRDAENPRRVADRLWRRTVFPGHPYGRPAGGGEATVSAISAEDLAGFARERLARDRLVVGVVGDVAEDELGRRLDEVFGGLPAKSRRLDVPRARVSGAGRTMVVRKRVPQSVAVLGHEGIPRDHPDWFAAALVAAVLGGGGLPSRLNEEVREKRGLAYGVRAYLAPGDRAALAMGRVATRNAGMGRSIEIVRREWRRIAEEGITADELRDAKAYADGSFPLRLVSGAGIADMLVSVQLAGLGIDYLDRRPALIAAVTLEQANRVARRLFRPDDLTVVVVGDPEGVAESP